MTTNEGNKLICEFMGLVGFNEVGHPAEFGYYDKQWDYLMPVVEKIGKMDEPFIKRMPVSDLSIFSTIEKVWKCVVDFILWYNNQTK